VRPERRYVLVLAALAAILAFAFQGSRGLYETTEGRYAESAREMLETGNWLVPQLDYAPHWTKPPLAYWAIAGGMALLGTNEWGARFANAVAFIFAVLVVSALARAMWDGRTGLVAGLIYALSPFAVLGASTVQTDLLLSLWELLAVLCYWRAYRAEGPQDARRWIVGMWALLGAAFLTKGPPGLIALVAILAFRIYLAATGRKGPGLRSFPGILLMLVVGLGWYVVVAARNPGLLDYFLGTEIYARIATAKLERNPEWYKPLVIFVPPLLFGAGTAMAAWIVELVKNRPLFGRRSLARLLREDERLAFLALWLVVPLVIFSLAKSRLPLYVLPIFPAAALATARVALRTIERPGFARAAIVAAIVTGAALVALKGESARYRSDLDMKALYGACREARRGETAFFLYDSRELFGLQFYLDGRLTRVAGEPLPAWARRSLDSVCHEILAAPRFDTYVFIVDAPWRGDALRKRFDELGVRFKATGSGSRYVLFACRAPSPSSNLAAASSPSSNLAAVWSLSSNPAPAFRAASGR
jgi:4-amino-4-deoxy-L-arabinose transferase-like glycosyltransferase